MKDPHMTLRQLALCLPVLFVVLLSIASIAWAEGDPLLTTPPPPPVRIPAEFEPMQAVLMDWDQCLCDLYRSVAEDVRLIFLWKSQGTYNSMQKLLSQHGVNMDNCEFYEVSYTPIVRDLIPWFAFIDHNEPALVYNQLDTQSSAIPQYGLKQGYTVYRSGLSIHGGDFMTDGRGIAVSLDNTTVSHAHMGDDFAQRVRDYWGVSTYHFISSGEYDYYHLDGVAKFLSPDTVMVVRSPIRRETSDAAAAYFRRQVTCYGTPYRVVRVDAPNEEPYINSLILNRRVFVPVVDLPSDADAIASYQAAMRGYEVVGVSNRYPGVRESLWMPLWALHCGSMGIADEKMLYIEHIPILDRPSAAQGFPVGAKIVAHSRTEFVDGTPAVLWRAFADANESVPPASWNTVGMVRAPELGDHQYLAHIPTQPVGTAIQYYIEAKDASGRDETHPYIGEAQAHTFTVKTLGANVSAISANRGGTIRIDMNAGTAHAQQGYRLTHSVWADDLNEDGSDSEQASGAGRRLEPDVALPETAVLAGFDGVLDDFVIATAQMTVTGPLTSDWVGRWLCFALELDAQENPVVDTAWVQILE